MSYNIFYAAFCSPMILMPNFRILVWGLDVFDFLFAIFFQRLSSILFIRSLHARLVILTRFMTSCISQMLRMSSLLILSRSVASDVLQSSSFPLFLEGDWWWLFPLLFQWGESLQASRKFYVFSSCSSSSCAFFVLYRVDNCDIVTILVVCTCISSFSFLCLWY